MKGRPLDDLSPNLINGRNGINVYCKSTDAREADGAAP
jgi:hypothetical protein